MSKLRRATVLVAASVLLVGPVLAAPSASAATYPTVSILTPTDGSTASGVVSITVQGDTDPAGTDSTSTLSVSIDGLAFGGYNCAANAAGASCTNTFSWDTTGLSGTHTIDASLSTAQGSVVAATTVTVTVSSPAPVASVTSPVDGATVSGIVTFGGRGVVDATQTDLPSSLTFYVDGKALSAQSCASLNVGKTCDSSVQWDTTGINGSHVLTVGLLTATGITVTSAPVMVTVSSPVPTVVLTSPLNSATVAGLVDITAVGTVDSSQTDAPTTMTFYDGTTPLKAVSCTPTNTVGKVCTVTITWNATGLSGTHALKAVLNTSRGLMATSAPANVVVSSPLPTISITSPTGGDTVAGLVSVSLAGHIDPSQVDNVDHLNLVDVTSGGNVVVSSVNCAAAGLSKDCVTNTSWDATGLSGTHKLHAELYSTNGLVVSSTDVSVNVSSPAPTANITAPANGANVAGNITLSFNANVDVSQVDYVDHIDLYLDNVLKTTYSCAAAQSRTCTGSFVWQATGISGDHTWVARVVTHRSLMASSSAATLHVSAPAPVATISSPSDSSTVSGVVSVATSGVVDASQVDSVSSLALYVDGTKSQTFTCSGVSKTCGYTFSWNSTGLSGAHRLVVEVATANGLKVQSATTNVTVNSPPPTAAIANVNAGDTVAGRVNFDVVGTVDATQVDATQSISLYLDGSKIRTAPCNGTGVPSKFCETVFTVDLTGVTGDHVVQAEVVTNLSTVSGTPLTVHVSSPAPTVVITSVKDGDTVSGLVSVSLHGAIDSTQNDFVDTLRLYVDDVLTRTTGPCSGGVPVATCDVSFNWDVSKLLGDHTLRSEIVTTRGRVASGATLTVHVSNPNPVVVITTPTPNAVVKGSVTVHAEATVAANVVDFADRITLFVDGTEMTHFSCSSAGATRTCAIDFTWDASKVIGQHTLALNFTTTNGLSVNSDVETVTVFADTVLTMSATKSVLHGRATSVAGQLVTAIGAQPLVGATVTVIYTPAIGAQHIVNVTTDANGRFATTYNAKSNTTIGAAYAGTDAFGKSVAKAKTAVRLAVSCKATPRSVHVGKVLTIRCAATGLVNGLQAWLQVASGSKWHTVLVASAGGSNRTFKVKAVGRGVLAVRVIVPSNRYFVSSTSPVMTLSIH